MQRFVCRCFSQVQREKMRATPPLYTSTLGMSRKKSFKIQIHSKLPIRSNGTTNGPMNEQREQISLCAEQKESKKECAKKERTMTKKGVREALLYKIKNHARAERDPLNYSLPLRSNGIRLPRVV